MEKLIKSITKEVLDGSINIYIDRSVEIKDRGYLHITTYEVKNDIDLDFMAVAEEIMSYDLEEALDILACGSDNLLMNVDLLLATDPISRTLVKEHVYDNPMKCELEHMSTREILECIQAL